MGASLLKIVAIIFIAAVIAFLVNYMQPDGLPLFHENNYEAARVDEKLNLPPAKENYTDYAAGDTLQHDHNKMAVEKNRLEISEDLLPSYNYKSDSDLGKKPGAVLPERSGSNGDVVLSNLTTDVFNQPRLISLAQALDLYMRAAEKSKNVQSREMLLQIAEEEQAHLKQLGKLIESL